MKIWRRVLSAALVLILAFSVVSCGGETAQGEKTADNKDTSAENTEITVKDDTDDKTAEDTAEQTLQEGTFTDEDGKVRQVTVHKSADELVTYYIDAEVLNKDASELPIIEVTHDYFDSDELKDIILPIIGDNTLYEKYAEWDRGDYSRTYESDYEYHPEEYYKSVYFNQGVIEFDPEVYEFNALSNVNGLPRMFRALRHHRGVVSVNNFIMGYYGLVDSVRDLPFLQTENFSDEDIENAIADVRDYLDSAGFEYWTLRKYEVERVESGKFQLNFDFVPTYYGTPMLFAAEKTGSYTWEFDVEHGWQYHELEISYSNGEIVDMFLRSPIDVVSEEQHILLSYDDAIETVCHALENSYTADKMLAQYNVTFPKSKNTILTWNVYVSKLELVYVRVPSAENPQHYYLIPSWVAYGTHGVDQQIRNNTVVKAGNKYRGVGEPILFISAIDGTPLDFTNGY